MDNIGSVITGLVLALLVLGTVIFCHERGMEEYGLRETIRSEVKAEMDRRYRNVPRIEIQKVYTLHAMGDDVVIDSEGPGDGTVATN